MKLKLYVLVLIVVSSALAIFVKQSSGYHWKNYESRTISFSYPSSWKFQACVQNGSLFVLRDKIPGIFVTDHEVLEIRAGGHVECIDGKSELRKSAKREANKSCTGTNAGAKLPNGLYFDLPGAYQGDNTVSEIIISRDVCELKYAETLFNFDLNPLGKSVGENAMDHGGEPRVKRDQFLASKQYSEIRRFAESIRIKPQ